MNALDMGLDIIGGHQRIAELGRGGMAHVSLAFAPERRGIVKLVVIKEIHRELADNPEIVSMFLDEAKLGARLNHPNVVQTHDVGSDGERPFLAMEYLEGQPLSRVISRLMQSPELTLGMRLRVVADALAGLHHAHELTDLGGAPLQVVHRDVSPQNLFITYAGQVKVIDFGIAKALDSSCETRAGALKGKVSYMAPEHALGRRLDRRADVFSAGILLWELLTGQRMFKGLGCLAIVGRLTHSQLPGPRSMDPAIPERLDAICKKALAREREDRYATAAELQADLEAAIVELGGRGSLRELGKLLERVFAAERQKIQRLVREAMAARTGARPAAAAMATRATRPELEIASIGPATPASALVIKPLPRVSARLLIASAAALVMVLAVLWARCRVVSAASTAPARRPAPVAGAAMSPRL